MRWLKLIIAYDNYCQFILNKRSFLQSWWILLFRTRQNVRFVSCRDGTKNIFHIIGWHKGLFLLLLRSLSSFSYVPSSMIFCMAYTTLSNSALSFPLFLYVTFPLPTYALTVEGTQVECLKSIPAWDKVLFDKMIRKIVKLQPKHQKRLYCKSNFSKDIQFHPKTDLCLMNVSLWKSFKYFAYHVDI